MAARKAHDMACVWFGFHVQYKCTDCGFLETFLYETGEPVGMNEDPINCPGKLTAPTAHDPNQATLL